MPVSSERTNYIGTSFNMSFHNTKRKSLTNSSEAERHDMHGD